MASRKRKTKSRKKKVLAATLPKSGQLAVPRNPLWEASWFPWCLLALLACLAYFNAWPDVFVFDDREFLSDGRFASMSLTEFANLFNQSLWEASGNTTQLYRPMFVLTLGLEYLVLGEWAAGFHLFNIFMHVVAVWMVFGFTRQLMKRFPPESGNKTLFALLASAIFAIHPAFSEVVNSVFNGSEIYVVIGIAGGLWYLLRRIEENPVRAWLILSFIYFVILLYRESAVSLPALAVVTLWFSSNEGSRDRIKQILPVLILAIPLSGYLVLRSHAMESPDQLVDPHNTAVTKAEPLHFAEEDAIELDQEETGELNKPDSRPGNPPGFGLKLNSDRLSSAVIVWFDGLKKLVWPHPLVTLHDGSSTPLYLAVLIQLSLFSLAITAALRKQPAFLLGLIFFYLAMLPSSRIIAESGSVPVLMERMLYLPSVGIVIFVAVGMNWLAGRVAIRAPVIAAIVLIILLLPVTWARNADWSDELTLMEHDFFVTEKNGQLFYSLVAANRHAGGEAEAMALCDTYANDFARAAYIQLECGKSFAVAGDITRAEDYFNTALRSVPGNAWTHFELARLCASTDRRDLAKSHFDQAISNEKLPFLRELFAAFKLMDLYPYDRQKLLQASQHIDNALHLQPRSREAKQLRQQLDQRL